MWPGVPQPRRVSRDLTTHPPPRFAPRAARVDPRRLHPRALSCACFTVCASRCARTQPRAVCSMIARQIPAARRPARPLRVAARAGKPERMFSDAEWDAVFKRVREEAEADAAAGASASAPGSGDGSVTAAAPDAPKPEGRMFSDAEWERAFKAASAEVDARKAAEATPASGGEAGAAAAPAGGAAAPLQMNIPPEERIFTDEQWEKAVKEVAAQAKVRMHQRRTQACARVLGHAR